MEMHQVRYFLAVAKHLNFTRAADTMRVAQPSLTRAIQKLEAELQGPLFRRERSNTHLTELGRMIMPHLEAAFSAAEAAKTQARRLRANSAGSLALGIGGGIDTTGAVALVTESARKATHLALSIELDETEAVERRLMAGEFDAAFVVHYGDSNERLDLHLVCEDDLVVAYGGGHRFSSGRDVPLEALDGEPLIAWVGCPSDEALLDLMHGCDRNLVVQHRTNDDRWIAAFVREGFGCAVVPRTMAEAHGLNHSKVANVSIRHRTVLATVAGRRHSAALNALIREVRAFAGLISAGSGTTPGLRRSGAGRAFA